MQLIPKQFNRKNPLLIGAIISLFIILLFLAFITLTATNENNRINISGIKPDYASAFYGIKPQGKNWNFQPVKVRGIYYPDSIFAHAPSNIVFTNSKSFRYFSATCAIEDNVGKQGTVRFLALVDGQAIFRSPVIRGGDPPYPCLVDIAGKKRIDLVVQEVENLESDQAVWLNPVFLSELPAGRQLSLTLPAQKLQPHIPQDMGTRSFPNRAGLQRWNFIVLVIYLASFLLLIMNRSRIIKGVKEWLTRCTQSPSSSILLIALLLSAGYLWPLFKPGFPLGLDILRHFLQCQIMRDVMLSNFSLDGINPYWYLGVQHLLFQGPFLYLLTNAFHFLSFQLVPLAVCYKIVIALSFMLLPLAIYRLLRQFKISDEASSLAALCVPSFSVFFGLGIEGLFSAGFVHQILALVVFTFALGSLKKSLDQGGRATVVAGLVIWVLFLTHIITAVFFTVVIALWSLIEAIPHRGIPYQENMPKTGRLIIPVGIGIMLSAYSNFTSIQFFSLQGPRTGFGVFTLGDFFSQFFSGNILSTVPINLIALLGISIAVYKRNSFFATLVILTPTILILSTVIPQFSASTLAANFRLFNLPWQLVFEYRTLVYLGIFFMVFTGLGIDWLISLIRRFSKAYRPVILPLFIILFTVFLAINVQLKLTALWPILNNDSNFKSPDAAAFYDIWRWLKSNTPENAVVAFEHRGELGDAALIDIGTRTNVYGDRYTVTGNFTEMTKAHNYSYCFSPQNLPPEALYSQFRRYNISYFFSWHDDTKDNLSKAPDLFHKVYRNFKITVWQVMKHDFRFIDNDNIKIIFFSYSPEIPAWQILNLMPDNLITVAFAYHPNWHLYLDGKPKPIIETADHLISFNLEDPGKKQIQLVFEKSPSEYFYYSISFLTLLLLIFYLMKSSRK